VHGPGKATDADANERKIMATVSTTDPWIVNQLFLNLGTLDISQLPALSCSTANVATLQGSLSVSNDMNVGKTLSVSGNVGIGTTTPPVEKLDVNGTVKATKFIGEGAFVPGMVVMWSGALTQIPPGWALCDGQHGTPDLRRRFIVGAASGTGQYPVGEKGGADTVTLTVAQMPTHNHNSGAWNLLLKADGTNTSKNTDNTRASEPNFVSPAGISFAGGNQAHENRPPYYALAYIMKL
jgi:microcystin-dependent protein